jgi:hypothetical protein
MSMNRREWMQKGATFALGIGLGKRLLASPGKSPLSGEVTPAASQKFPPKFLWGAFAILPNCARLHRPLLGFAIDCDQSELRGDSL